MNIAWILTVTGCLFYLQPSHAELKLVQTLFRHGNRMPSYGRRIYPNDPYSAMTYEPEGFGGLTNAGKELAYKLGQYFRERYDKFLGPLYSKEIVRFRADENERVVMTAELVAASLFPPQEEQIWNSRLNWQPIPIWAPEFSNDHLYNGMFCPNFMKWRINVEKTDREVMKFEEENKEIYKYLSQHTGANITQSSTFSLRQIFYEQTDIGLELPKWTKSVFPNGKLDELAVFDIHIRTRTPELKKLLGGVWIQEWLKNIDNYLNGNDNRKAFMYAGHELTIAPILVVLDNFDNKIPSYCSSLIVELHENNNKHYVQVLYRNNDDTGILKIPGCGTGMCPLETFRNFVAPMLPEDIGELCGIEEDSKSTVQQ
ncbi:PREDICTED: venom acid phosphatase Acph-1-like [Dufourea novaeangliae]|uniref:acid phosphatase n=1 Tax=Dufourea novaeangliae TaxID=178035 RepID=A0A154NY05_DUFNO|nr:PREDICTED: venom acid phosphatase Acph-1-like [Dufourea novaeangliae]KZC03760.1 Venom acid phosphatase Acph-1 [Dufourea novaeangliae]